MIQSFSEYQEMLDGIESLNEKMMTFNRNKDSKFGNIVIMAGGAGSGKGFVIDNLVGIAGKQFDVDKLKEIALKTTMLKARLKDEYGIDTEKDPNFLKDPTNTSKLHAAISDLRLPANKESYFLSQAALAPQDRKPNIIFDVTLQNIGKLVNISAAALEAGYDIKKIHLVWVVNKLDVAIQQNATRARVVNSDILLDTHEGASRVMRKIIDMGDGVRKYLDGDMYFAFNQIDVDSSLLKSSFGGKYVKSANYVQVKVVGQSPMKYSDMEDTIIKKIVEYTPKTMSWEKDLN